MASSPNPPSRNPTILSTSSTQASYPQRTSSPSPTTQAIDRKPSSNTTSTPYYSNNYNYSIDSSHPTAYSITPTRPGSPPYLHRLASLSTNRGAGAGQASGAASISSSTAAGGLLRSGSTASGQSIPYSIGTGTSPRFSLSIESFELSYTAYHNNLQLSPVGGGFVAGSPTSVVQVGHSGGGVGELSSDSNITLPQPSGRSRLSTIPSVSERSENFGWATGIGGERGNTGGGGVGSNPSGVGEEERSPASSFSAYSGFSAFVPPAPPPNSPVSFRRKIRNHPYLSGRTEAAVIAGGPAALAAALRGGGGGLEGQRQRDSGLGTVGGTVSSGNQGLYSVQTLTSDCETCQSGPPSPSLPASGLGLGGHGDHHHSHRHGNGQHGEELGLGLELGQTGAVVGPADSNLFPVPVTATAYAAAAATTMTLASAGAQSAATGRRTEASGDAGNRGVFCSMGGRMGRLWKWFTGGSKKDGGGGILRRLKEGKKVEIVGGKSAAERGRDKKGREEMVRKRVTEWEKERKSVMEEDNRPVAPPESGWVLQGLYGGGRSLSLPVISVTPPVEDKTPSTLPSPLGMPALSYSPPQQRLSEFTMEILNIPPEEPPIPTISTPAATSTTSLTPTAHSAFLPAGEYIPRPPYIRLQDSDAVSLPERRVRRWINDGSESVGNGASRSAVSLGNGPAVPPRASSLLFRRSLAE